MAAAPAGRILIVDDEVGLMTALQESLAQQGYETAGAQSALDALRLLKEQEFDLLLCDLMMPGMDGITLLFEAQAQDPDLAGIIMTGQATIQTAVDAMKIGAYDYVLKPFKLSTLLPILERALQVRRLRMDNLRLRETLAIYELAQTVSSPFDLDALLRKIADAALQQCPAKQISILLPTRERNELYVAFERGERLEHRVGCRIPMEQGLAGLATPAAAPATPQRAMDDIGEAKTESRGNGSALAFPLMAGGRLVGVLQVTVAPPSRALTAGQRTAMNILAGLAASILENARQFEEIRLGHKELQTHARRQAAVTELGRFALAGDEILALLNKAAALLIQTLAVDYSKVLELLPGGQSLLLRAGVGWRPEAVGQATVGTDLNSQAGYTLISKRPVIVDDLRTETRFTGPPLLHEHGIVSGLSVIIHGRTGPWGVLGVHTTHPRQFTGDDANFVQAIANVLAAAIERKQAEETLRASEERYALAGRGTNEGLWDWNTVTNDAYLSTRWKELLGFEEHELEHHANTFFSRLHPEDVERVTAARRDHWEHRVPYDVEFRLRTKSGGYRWFRSRGQAIWDETGQAIRMTGAITDIMDRKQVEEERERLLAELQVAHKRQSLLSRQLLEAHESERRDVARDLHDDIGQMLIALKMNLQCADAASVPTEKRTTALSESLQLADRLIHEVRELALSLRPPLLDELGLAPALKAFAERQIQRAGLQLDFAADPLDPAPDANLATACFRVAQEAMSNAIRHARAGTLTVRLRRRDTNLELLVRDDGAGFDVPIARGEAGRGRSMGLLSMEERVRLLGGQIAITSAPGQGTEICASFPLHRPPQPLEESPSS